MNLPCSSITLLYDRDGILMEFDTSNIADALHYSDKMKRIELVGMLDGVKSDRTTEDLLFGQLSRATKLKAI